MTENEDLAAISTFCGLSLLHIGDQQLTCTAHLVLLIVFFVIDIDG